MKRWRRELGLSDTPGLKDYELEVVVKIRDHIPELATVAAHKLVELWEKYSDNRCASFLICDEESLLEFWEWCSDDVYGEENEAD